ncbi:hypothetical protein NBRC116602_03770 [Hyphomicrobiales bacterium 4NK60-0047b]
MTEDEFKQKKDLYAFIGISLIHVQFAEKMFKDILLLVIQNDEFLDLEKMKKQNHFLERKTLGQLISVLKKRVDLDDDFEQLLLEFIDDRNTLAHNLNRVEGYEIHTVDGRTSMNEFLSLLNARSQKIIKILGALLYSWKEQVGFQFPEDEFAKSFIGEEYLAMTEKLFFRKEI